LGNDSKSDIQVHAAEIEVLRKVPGATLCDKLRSCEIH